MPRRRRDIEYAEPNRSGYVLLDLGFLELDVLARDRIVLAVT